MPIAGPSVPIGYAHACMYDTPSGVRCCRANSGATHEFQQSYFRKENMSSNRRTGRAIHSPAGGNSVGEALRQPRVLLRELLAGLVVALALIPEAISFSVIAGVDPRVGLFSSFVMAVSIAVLGGRPAMITAATGAVALVIAPVMRDYGFDYFIATVLLAGVLQIVLAFLGVAKLMRFIPRSVMVGFVNALALLVLSAQLPELIGVPWAVYPLVAVGILIIVVVPKLTTVVPAPLISVVLVTAVAVVFALDVPTVGDRGELPHSLPEFFFPQVPITWETLSIIGPFALGMAFVGLLESLMTAKLVDDLTDTPSNKTRETWAQGVANLLAGMFGGMGGCAVVGQTMINVKVSGARTRLSTFFAGALLLALILLLGDVVSLIPMAALVAVMIMVSVTTFDWHSISPRTLTRLPKSETAVMLLTVLVVLVTHNLAIGVVSGVLIAAVLFARRVAHLVTVERDIVTSEESVTAHYRVHGELFFASSNDLTTLFDYASDPQQIVIDMSGARIWDASSVAAVDAIITKYERRGKTVRLEGMAGFSEVLHGRLTGTFSGQ